MTSGEEMLGTHMILSCSPEPPGANTAEYLEVVDDITYIELSFLLETPNDLFNSILMCLSIK